METARIKVESNATHNLPLIIVVRQTTGILSWQIPLVVTSTDLNTVIYNKTSRTLCSMKYYRYAQNDEEYVIVGISTASRENILFDLSMVKQKDFYLRHVLYKRKIVKKHIKNLAQIFAFDPLQFRK